MILLSIESSSILGSVTLTCDGEIIEDRFSTSNENSQILPLFIKEISCAHPIEFQHLDGIVLSEGPGSYTGLRIGTGIAKGLCYGLSLPLYIVSTLQLLLVGLLTENPNLRKEDAIFFPMIDARRMEVYTVALNALAERLSEVKSLVIKSSEDFFTNFDVVGTGEMRSVSYFFGDGAEKCCSVLQNDRFHYIPDIVPQSKYLALTIERGKLDSNYKKLVNKEIAYYEPFYLKPYIAKLSEVKGLHKI